MLTPSKQKQVSGFSLVELLVVIIIILILVVIGVAGMSALEDDAARNKTKLALRNAEMVTDEFRRISDQIIFIKDNSDMQGDYELRMRHRLGSGPTPPELEDRLYKVGPWEVHGGAWKHGQFTSNSVVIGMLSAGGHSFDISGLESTLARIPDDIFYASGYGTAMIRDGWGRHLHYAHFVTDNESVLPQHPRPFWTSAGPDGKLGDATEDVDGDGTSDDAETTYDEPYHVEWSQDNIYSFDLE